jgi:hypothetical protein
MRSLVVLAAFGSVAHAEVAIEVAGGGGGETEGTGYAVASTAARAELVREAAPFEERGLHHCDIQAAGCMWVFTGLDPDQIDGAGAAIDSSVLMRADGETLIAGGEVWAAAAGWRLSAKGAVQPIGDLREPFWRSGRGIYSRTIRVDIPSMWAIGNDDHQLIVMPSHVALGERTLRENGAWEHAGFDRDIALVGFRWQSKYHTFDLADMHYVEWGVKESRAGDVTYGKSAGTFDVGGSLRVRPLRQLELFARASFAMFEPVSEFMIVGTSQHSTGPLVDLATYWGEASLELAGLRAVLGGGTWTRIDPSGHAVDHGHTGSVEVARAGDRIELKGSAQLGRLQRVLVGTFAPEGIVPVGTRMVMGRAAIGASIRVVSSVRLAATAWIERSDRDDPRWYVPGAGLATRAGADLSATWRFERAPRRPSRTRVE